MNNKMDSKENRQIIGDLREEIKEVQDRSVDAPRGTFTETCSSFLTLFCC